MNVNDKYYVISKDLIKTTAFQKTLEAWSEMSLTHTGKSVTVLEGCGEVSSIKVKNSLKQYETRTKTGGYALFNAFSDEFFSLQIQDIHGSVLAQRYINKSDFINFLESEKRSLQMSHMATCFEKYTGSINAGLVLSIIINDQQSVIELTDKEKFIENIKKVKI